ncbi:MAG: B-box zinc finger protein, partial [Candidatus Coatesbacteria bacterium]
MTEERELQMCGRHPEVPAVARCVVCGEPLCGACATVVAGKYYCSRDASAARAEPPPARPRSGRLRPGYLAAVAALVLAGWGILFALRPAMEYAAGLYR